VTAAEGRTAAEIRSTSTTASGIRCARGEVFERLGMHRTGCGRECSLRGGGGPQLAVIGDAGITPAWGRYWDALVRDLGHTRDERPGTAWSTPGEIGASATSGRPTTLGWPPSLAAVAGHVEQLRARVPPAGDPLELNLPSAPAAQCVETAPRQGPARATSPPGLVACAAMLGVESPCIGRSRRCARCAWFEVLPRVPVARISDAGQLRARRLASRRGA